MDLRDLVMNFIWFYLNIFCAAAVCKLVEGSYEMSDSLIGLKSVTYALVAIQFVLICIVDNTVLQLSMSRDNGDTRSVDMSQSLDSIDTEPLVTADQTQVLIIAQVHTSAKVSSYPMLGFVIPYWDFS